MSTRRPSTWYIWTPLLILALLVGLYAVFNSRSAQEGPPLPSSGASASALGPSATTSAGTGRGSPASGTPATSTPASALVTIPESTLPRQAKDTLRLIRAGGPFPFDQDNAVFQNREGILPPQPRGYYREFTVPTPGSGDRGPRRLVTGREGDIYWTTDHYDSFRQVLVGR